MASLTAPFILKVRNAIDTVVSPVTRSIKFSGGIITTQVGPGQVEVFADVGTLGAWGVVGNASDNSGGDSGFVLGTTTLNSWRFISNNQTAGGFSNSGEFFLKNHSGFAGSEKYHSTNGVQTLNNTPVTIFTLPVQNDFVGRIKCSIQGRRTDGLEMAAFERSVLFNNLSGILTLSTKVHSSFTDKTQDDYNVLFSASGTNLVVQVVGKALETINWSGSFEWQMVSGSV